MTVPGVLSFQSSIILRFLPGCGLLSEGRYRDGGAVSKQILGWILKPGDEVTRAVSTEGSMVRSAVSARDPAQKGKQNELVGEDETEENPTRQNSHGGVFRVMTKGLQAFTHTEMLCPDLWSWDGALIYTTETPDSSPTAGRRFL